MQINSLISGKALNNGKWTTCYELPKFTASTWQILSEQTNQLFMNSNRKHTQIEWSCRSSHRYLQGEKKIQNWLPNTLCEASKLAQFSILLKLCSVAHVIIMLYIGLRGSYFLRLKYVSHNFVKFLSCYCAKKEKLSLIQKKIKEKVK